jgi:plasmid stabilization system protein ParE
VPRRYRVEIARAAERDLLGIYDYIERDSQQRAVKWFLEIERQIRTLARSPKRCPVIPESEEIGREYRHLIHGSYRTIFRIEGEAVYVLRVVHGARLLDTSALE